MLKLLQIYLIPDITIFIEIKQTVMGGNVHCVLASPYYI